MPNRAEILERIARLNSHCWALTEQQEDGEVWSGREHGATFELSKAEGVVFEKQRDTSCLILVLTGNVTGKRQLERDFKEALGEPLMALPARRFRYPQMLSWNSSQVPTS
ncbi:hypothetical protein M1146_00685 [Patescibacteria group bacterium]|nr:hypothetical protein [Patescibacteria group bacterium]